MTQSEINKLMVSTFNNELGLRCLDYLESVFVDRPTYKTGMSIEEVAFREGQADIVRQIRKSLVKRSK